MHEKKIVGDGSRDAVRPVEAKVAKAEWLEAIRLADPTGGVRVADCKHGFRDMLIVSAKGNYHFILCADIKCWRCGAGGHNVISHPIDRCPICGTALADANMPWRNYFIGHNVLVDEHLFGIGAFGG